MFLKIFLHHKTSCMKVKGTEFILISNSIPHKFIGRRMEETERPLKEPKPTIPVEW